MGLSGKKHNNVAPKILGTPHRATNILQELYVKLPLAFEIDQFWGKMAHAIPLITQIFYYMITVKLYSLKHFLFLIYLNIPGKAIMPIFQKTSNLHKMMSRLDIETNSPK